MSGDRQRAIVCVVGIPGGMLELDTRALNLAIGHKRTVAGAVFLGLSTTPWKSDAECADL